ncbi:MAG: PadR family transcriptional regulator [Oscillospiraceae bacterium]|nr:PadR family transcriptional regulator [Oscillospiraceae bacterium]
MNTQFKKGVLELIVLLVISKEDKYGYQLVSEVGRIVDVNEGTIYPLLKRLTNEKYCETYLEQSAEGPARKYYKITVAGRVYLDILKREWLEFSQTVNNFIKETSKDDKE